jgi:hypothetical protein
MATLIIDMQHRRSSCNIVANKERNFLNAAQDTIAATEN